MVIYEEGLGSCVRASWDLETKVAGAVSTQHFSKVIYLIKNSDKWYINQVI